MSQGSKNVRQQICSKTQNYKGLNKWIGDNIPVTGKDYRDTRTQTNLDLQNQIGKYPQTGATQKMGKMTQARAKTIDVKDPQPSTSQDPQPSTSFASHTSDTTPLR